MTLLAFAPTWLGDAVMCLPALADLVRSVQSRTGASAGGQVAVAARAGVAGLFDLVPGVDRVVPVRGGGLRHAVAAVPSDARALRAVGASRAVLFPNSAQSALTVWLAGVPERWGYRRDLRGALLTHGVARPAGRHHHVDVYRHLAAAAGGVPGDRAPALDVPARLAKDAEDLLAARGWDGARPIVGLAPGAAFGGAKRWPADRFARVVAATVRDRGATCVLVGGRAEAETTYTIAAEAAKMTGRSGRGDVIDLAGATSLPLLASVLARCAAFVSNDSGAMHLASAVGTPVVAVFGPTDDRATAPVTRAGSPATILAGTAWCRPCGMRECPLDQRCMTTVPADRVIQAVGELL